MRHHASRGRGVSGKIEKQAKNDWIPTYNNLNDTLIHAHDR